MSPFIDHIALRVSNLDQAISFYTDVLKCDLDFRTLDEEHHEAFAFLQMEGGRIELLQKLDADNQPMAYERPPVAPPFCPHLALGCADLDEWIVELQKRGVPLIEGPLVIAKEVKWLYIADPDGNILEFVQWLK
ncbi:MAG TPA: VOC family protein [bacterium]|nr:VOC family protein [bacterium]HPN33711.1 VOC family protein [bacterium]